MSSGRIWPWASSGGDKGLSRSGAAWNPDLYASRHSFVWKYGEEMLEMLGAKPGERILDLGCGTGQLAARIAESGAEVVGLDSSAEMIGRARETCPGIRFIQADAAAFRLNEDFDAVFSNAALHWVKKAGAAADCIAAALKPGGRFVAEFGGKDNCRLFLKGLHAVAARHGFPVGNPWYFPGIGEYAGLLESRGLEVVEAGLIDRWTPLEGDDGLRSWIEMFGAELIADVPGQKVEGLLEELEDRVRPVLYRDGRWWMDYRRIRVRAFRNPGE